MPARTRDVDASHGLRRAAQSGCTNNTLKVWDLRSGEYLCSFHGEAPVRALSITTDGRMVVAGDDLGRVHFFSLEGI